MKVPILRLSNALVKIWQILHVILQTTSQLFFKFCITLQCHKDNSSVLFYVKRYILSTKGINKSGHFENVECSGQNLPNSCHFCITLQCHEIWLLYTFLAETLYTFNKRSLSSSHINFEKLVCAFKYDRRNLANFHPTAQKSENAFSMGSFCPKYAQLDSGTKFE